MKATEQYFAVVPFIMLYRVVLTFESVDEILKFPDHSIESRSISARSVQLSPMGSELGWGLLAGQSESRKFLCPNMERLCAALKSSATIYMYVQCFAKMYSSSIKALR